MESVVYSEIRPENHQVHPGSEFSLLTYIPHTFQQILREVQDAKFFETKIPINPWPTKWSVGKI